MRNILFYSLFMLLGGALYWGCDSTADEATEGHLRVLLTDGPFPVDLADEANVTIERVELVGGKHGVTVIADTTQPFNLLELQNGVTAELADWPILPGTYSQLRLIVADSASILLKDGSTHRMKVPSGTETGIKILLPDFEVDGSADSVEVTVDFVLDKSFEVQGDPNTPAGINGFIFTPVIKPVQMTVNGVEVELNADSTSTN